MYTVSLGKVANIVLGAEVKIMAKAMIKQMERVGTDLENQAKEFKRHGNDPICVGILAINYASHYTSFEGQATWPTDGKKYKHPIQEASTAEATLSARVADKYDELICLRYAATNAPPLDFRWVDEADTNLLYGAALVRLSALYDRRF
jgi:hypothetical protein